MAKKRKKSKKGRAPAARKPVAREPSDTVGIQELFLKKQHLICVLLIAILGFVIYSNTFGVPFSYDDGPLILDNPALTGFHFQQFPTSLGATRQIGFLSFSLNYMLSGTNVIGYHVVNLIIHILNAVMVYWLVILTLRTPFFQSRNGKSPSGVAAGLLALFSGLLFVSHPLQTQAVTYISQRFASMATLFYLASLLMYIKWRMPSNNGTSVPGNGKGANWYKRAIFYIATIVFAVLAMRTKEISFTIPVVIALFEFSFFTGKVERRIVNLLPVFATMLVIPLSIMGSGGLAGDSVQEIRGVTAGISYIDYLLTQFRVIVTYLRLFFFPIGQNLDYDYPLYRSITDLNVLLSFILLATLVGSGVYLFRLSGRKDPLLRLITFGIFWFFISLAVESSINPITNLIDEHRMYLPSVGLIIALVASVCAVWERLKQRLPRSKSLIVPVSFLVIAVFAVTAFARNTVWQNHVRLWQDVVRKSPDKARPHTNLGISYKEVGQLYKAQSEFELALKVDPDFEPEKGHYNLGVNYLRIGDTDMAVNELKQALAIKPDFVEAHSNLGAAYMNLGQYDRAAAEFEEAIGLSPDLVEAHYNLGISYQQLGQNEKAAAEFEEVLRIDPGFTQARSKLEEISRATGR